MASRYRTGRGRLFDARSPIHGIASSLAVTGLALIEPRGLSAKRRLCYRIAVAGVTAWTAWAELRSSQDPEVPPALSGAVAAGASGAALALAPAAERLDAKLVDRLAGAGVSRPRRVLALASGALMLGSWWASRRIDRWAEFAFDGQEDPEELLSEVPTAAAALVDLLLAAAPDHGAALLREQFAAAQAVGYDESEVGEYAPFLELRIPSDLPRTVPGNFTFPITGRFDGPDGAYVVSLTVEDGHLSSLEVDGFAPEGFEHAEDWSDEGLDAYDLEEWPSASSVTLFHDTPLGVQRLQ